MDKSAPGLDKAGAIFIHWADGWPAGSDGPVIIISGSVRRIFDMREKAKLFLALLLCLVMALPAVSLGESEPEKFTLAEESTFDLVNGKTYLYEHVKTGALVMFVINDDLNRVFQLGFRTPAETDMGVSHVFEHATLGGSEKYPSEDLFFNLSY